MQVRTRLGEIRRAKGVSAAELASRVGVARQTIYAIEDGTFVPNTAIALQLGQMLDVSVEEIFSLGEESAGATVSAELLTADRTIAPGQLARICRVDQRMIAVPVSSAPSYLPAADGMVIESRKKAKVLVDSPASLLETSNRLLLAGCDPALSLLGEALRSTKIEIISVPCSSRQALQWLKQAKVHAAGSHLLDRATGDYNVPIVRRMLSPSVRVVTFAIWEQGLVFARGNPKGIRSIADLGSGTVKLVNREKGSGSRDLLDKGLQQFGILARTVPGYRSLAQGHLAAAYAVSVEAADCCIATRSAARCFGLGFLPLAVERFDLTFASDSLELPATKALLDVLNRASMRKKLETFAGYDSSRTGDVLM